MTDRMIVCSFSSKLDDLPKKKRRDPVSVLRVLAKIDRFSCFEVCDRLAPTLDRLKDNGFIEYTDKYGYPWAGVVVTKKGQQYLLENAHG